MSPSASKFRQLVAEGSYALAAEEIGPFIQSFELAYTACPDAAARILLLHDVMETLTWARKLAYIGRARIAGELDRIPEALRYNTAATASSTSWTLDA